METGVVMSYGFEHVPAITNWTYPEEEAMWHAGNPPPSCRDMEMPKSAYLDIVKKAFAGEYAFFTDYLTGKTELPKKHPAWMELEFKLRYITHPHLFEDDVAHTMRGYGELTFEDEAWIRNTGKLVEKYNGIYRKMKEANDE